jgi:hypothetical protein
MSYDIAIWEQIQNVVERRTCTLVQDIVAEISNDRSLRGFYNEYPVPLYLEHCWNKGVNVQEVSFARVPDRWKNACPGGSMEVLKTGTEQEQNMVPQTPKFTLETVKRPVRRVFPTGRPYLRDRNEGGVRLVLAELREYAGRRGW